MITNRASGPGSIIQSSLGTDDNNFEVVVLEDSELVHYFHDNSDVTSPWQRAQVITNRASGPGSIIQSSLGTDDNNFEVVVLEGSELVHYFHDNSDATSPWQRAQAITNRASGPGSIIQSSLGTDDNNFEVVVLEDSELVHDFHDNSDVTTPWQRAQVITPRASGPGSIIQGSLGTDGNNFEVVVLEGSELVHYFHDNSDVTLAWQRAQVITTRASGPGSIIQGSLGTDGNNFELVVLDDSALVHYFHDNSDVASPWQRGQEVVAPATYCFFSTDHSDAVVMGRSVLARSDNGGIRFARRWTMSESHFINVSIEPVAYPHLPGLPELSGSGLMIFGSGVYRASDAYLPTCRREASIPARA